MTSTPPPGPGAPGQVPACPDCGAPFETDRPARCGRCRLPLTGAAAATLWQVTLALQGVEAQRLVLLRQRDDLLAGLRARRDEPEGAPAPVPALPAWGPQRPGAPGVPGHPEVSGRSAQTALLVLGGLLVSIAALVFTVVSWGYLGIGGRAAVLAAPTGCALALPPRLRRRGLSATAETSAAIGLALVLLDFFAARAAGLAGLDAVALPAYWAAATALTGAGAAAYGWVLRLRLPVVAGVLLWRLPGLLVVDALGLGGADAVATAMVATAAVDLAVLRAVAGRAPARALPAAGAVTAAVTAPAAGPAAGAASRRTVGAVPLQAAGAVAALWGGLGAFLAGQASLSAVLVPRLPAASAAAAAAADERWAVVLGAWLPLGCFALLALVVSLRHPRPGRLGLPAAHRRVAAALGGVALLVACGGTVAAGPAREWGAVAYAAPAALLALATGALLRGSGRDRTGTGEQASGPRRMLGQALPLGLFHAAALVLLVASVPALGEIVRAVLAPLGQVRAAWAGGPAESWAWSVAPAAVTGLWLLLAVLAALAGYGLTRADLQIAPAAPAAAAAGVPAPAWAAATRADAPAAGPVPADAPAAGPAPGPASGPASGAASGPAAGPVGGFATAAALLAVPALALLPVALGLPYGVAVAVAAGSAVAAVAYALSRPVRPATVVAPVTAAVLALLWAPADRVATVAVLAVLAALSVVLAVRAGAAPAGPGLAVRAVAAACAVAASGAEGAAVTATAGGTLPDVTLAMLGVAVASAPVAARTGGAVSRAVEGAGYALGALALLLTAGSPGRLAFALVVAGVAMSGVALRPERRRAASLAATALLIVSSWIRLALSGVGTPEAYTLSAAVAALVIGGLRLRRHPGAGSWTAYGPGLGLGLAPSLPAMWVEGGWLRPLLLGSAALVVTVLGARSRLQCPLVLGGGVLLLVAVHELAPVVVQVLGLLPRWVPLAFAGLLLLVLGATYEQRLRDARRLRASLGRLH
ncbi:SCO7613 C-terminal domain-containing membrane protein [Kitasatospora indigofera]|uniref:SCO7613 C-terminal domain-containing membrane protein n=1 Tax=Kitasatospora indigofera TaxID=67307 RepID=UPI0036370091